MPRKRITQSPSSRQRTSKALPARHQPSDDLSGESAFSDYPDAFFIEDIIRYLPGTSNVLLVAPNLSPDTDDKNVGLLSCLLTETLGAYAVVNCGLYRRPVDGDPAAEELQLSDSPQPSGRNRSALKLRQRFLEKTGGIPVNLDSFNSASLAAYEYVEAIWLTAAEIGSRAIPLAFFLCGIDDAKADELDLDVAVGAGYLLGDKEQVYRGDTGSAGGAFVEELIGRLRLLRDGIRVRDGVEGYALDGDEVAGGLRFNWRYEQNRPSGEALTAKDVHSVLLAIRYAGFRDSKDNLTRTVQELAQAISGLGLFESWREGKTPESDEKKPDKSTGEKAQRPSQKSAPAQTKRSPRAGARNAMTKKPTKSAWGDMTMISQEKFREKVEALRGLTTIKDDRKEEVAFEGEAKDLFIAAFEQGYPVIERALSSMHELGAFLSDVRDKLKPHKLYYAWLEHAGIPERTASNYVQVYGRYSDKLPNFAYLGIKKLLTASALKDCVDYVEKNEQVIASQSAEELRQAVKALRSAKKPTTGRGRKPTYIEIGKSRLRPSQDGTRLVIEGITEAKQKELIEAIKAMLS